MLAPLVFRYRYCFEDLLYPKLLLTWVLCLLFMWFHAAFDVMCISIFSLPISRFQIPSSGPSRAVEREGPWSY